jgi:lipopolysaccharide/colanic/teichoic acid biosynthesis glycosyltransferase
LFVYWLKFGDFNFDRSAYNELAVILIVTWIALSAYYKKYDLLIPHTFQQVFRNLLNQSTLVLLFLSLFCSLTKLNVVSRLFLLQIVYLPTLIEMVTALVLNRYSEQNQNDKKKSNSQAPEKIHYARVMMSGLLLAIVFFGLDMLGISIHGSDEIRERTILLLILSWITSSSLTSKFKAATGQNLYYKISPFYKSSILMTMIYTTAYYFGRIEESSIDHYLLLPIMIFGLTELSLAYFYFKYVEIPIQPKIIDLTSQFGQENLIDDNNNIDSYIENRVQMLRQLESIDFKNGKEILDTIKSYFKSHNLNPRKFRIFYNRSIFDIQILKPSSIDCVLNYYSTNDIQKLNDYFHACYNAISVNGLLIGIYTPQDMDRWNLERRMPRAVFVVYYPIHYLLKRVLPKLPWTSRIYTTLTQGRKKLISKAELWGRLAYAGFAVNQESKLNGTVLFIAQKTLTPAQEKYPSYGPVIKLKRIGLNGEAIRIYKLRTMFPYSEFIQKQVYAQNSIDGSGKLKNDFRKNNAGIVLRKFWLDELPQLYNWIKGDITLVGVRALSDHYLSLYPLDLQEQRKKFKPGLLPPYYADLPKSFDEIFESERQYLNKKDEHPLKTDIIYLSKILVNIFFRGARSG